ncbi:putative replication protein [Zea mays]|uniref:Putative replication protein n=1 Tax=Zea mays TaxID=4577 RepID=A0A1D6GUC6_MAIZE|nr:putative replication protein [Zea mays]
MQPCRLLNNHMSSCLKMGDILIPTLMVGDCSHSLCVRVSRLWEFLDPQDDSRLLHTNLVLLDEEGNNIHAQIYPPLCQQFSALLDEGGIPPAFPVCTYNLTPIEQLQPRVDYKEYFTDVLGVVSVISHVSSLRTRGRQAEVMKRTVTISNARDTGPTVDVVLWGERATAFPAEQVHRDSGSSPQIIIFVGTLVRSYADNVSLSGGSSCKWYINAPVPEVNALRASAEPNHCPVIWDQGKVAAESTIAAVPEHKKLKDIKYLHPFENKKKEWLVIVKVLKIDRSWWYNACKKCLRTTKPHGDTYKCTNNSCDSIGSPTPRSDLISGQGSGVPQNKGTTFIHEPSLTPESRKVSSSAKTSPHQGDNLLLGTEIIPAPPNVQTPSGAHNTPGANTLRLADAYSVLDGSTNKTHKSVTRKRSRTSPSKKAAKKRFRDEGITDDDVAGSTDVDAE